MSNDDFTTPPADQQYIRDMDVNLIYFSGSSMQSNSEFIAPTGFDEAYVRIVALRKKAKQDILLEKGAVTVNSYLTADAKLLITSMNEDGGAIILPRIVSMYALPSSHVNTRTPVSQAGYTLHMTSGGTYRILVGGKVHPRLVGFSTADQAGVALSKILGVPVILPNALITVYI